MDGGANKISSDELAARAPLCDIQECAFKFPRELREHLPRIVRKGDHGALMALRIDVALKAVLVSTLLLAYLTEPS